MKKQTSQIIKKFITSVTTKQPNKGNQTEVPNRLLWEGRIMDA